MTDHQEIVAKLQQAVAAAAQCSAVETTGNYEVLGEELGGLELLAKRSCESHVDCKSLVSKLQAGSALAADEMATLRLMIVGDADYLLKYDEEFERCKNELGKIVAEIQQMQASEFDIDALMHLRVLCREAQSMLAPTGHYLQEKDRIRRFEAAIRGPIDRDTGRTLAGVISEMLRH